MTVCKFCTKNSRLLCAFSNRYVATYVCPLLLHMVSVCSYVERWPDGELNWLWCTVGRLSTHLSEISLRNITHVTSQSVNVMCYCYAQSFAGGDRLTSFGHCQWVQLSWIQLSRVTYECCRYEYWHFACIHDMAGSKSGHCEQ